jgi:hypothetical protein
MCGVTTHSRRGNVTSHNENAVNLQLLVATLRSALAVASGSLRRELIRGQTSFVNSRLRYMDGDSRGWGDVWKFKIIKMNFLSLGTLELCFENPWELQGFWTLFFVRIQRHVEIELY